MFIFALVALIIVQALNIFVGDNTLQASDFFCGLIFLLVGIRAIIRENVQLDVDLTA